VTEPTHSLNSSAGPRDAGWRVVGEAASERASGTCSSGTAVPCGWGEDVLFEMECEWAKNWVGVAVGVHCFQKVVVEACDGHADCAHGSLGAVCGARAVLALEFWRGSSNSRSASAFSGSEASSESGWLRVRFPAEQGAHCFGVVEGEAALLEAGGA